MSVSVVGKDVKISPNSTKEAERKWHDDFYRSHAKGEYPESLAEFREKFRRVELTPFCEGGWSWWADPRREALDQIGEVRGLRILDYGCGFGALGMYLSSCGGHVWGFDLSHEATDIANETARRYGLSAKFEPMDAENLTYPDDFFDLVVGFGVLHHVIKYPHASAGLRRVMRPGGRAVFVETLWDNPLINLVRRFTLAEDDAGDAHLTDRNIREFAENFHEIHLEKRHLLYMLKRLVTPPERNLQNEIRPRPFLKVVKRLDEKLLIPPMRRYCGEVIVFMWR
jgi:2-polyprenyl-3-methyl-5-hydroxy-6-metoxy-1,4-benzoquinol methylase